MAANTSKFFDLFADLIVLGSVGITKKPKEINDFSGGEVASDRIVAAAEKAGRAVWNFCHEGSEGGTVFDRVDAVVAFLDVAVHSELLPPLGVSAVAAANPKALPNPSSPAGFSSPASASATSTAVSSSVDNTLAVIVKSINACGSSVNMNNGEGEEASAGFTLRVLSTAMLKAFAAVPWCSFLSNTTADINKAIEKENAKGILGAATAPATVSFSSSTASSLLLAGLPPPPRRPTLSVALEADLLAARTILVPQPSSSSPALDGSSTASSSAAACINNTTDSSSEPCPPLIRVVTEETALTRATAPIRLPMTASVATVKALCTGAFYGANAAVPAVSAATTTTPNNGNTATPTNVPSATAANAIVSEWFAEKLQNLYRPRRVAQMYRSTLLLLPKGPIVAAAAAATNSALSPSANTTSASTTTTTTTTAAPTTTGAPTSSAMPQSLPLHQQQSYRASHTYIQCEAVTCALEAYLTAVADERERKIKIEEEDKAKKTANKLSPKNKALKALMRNLREACGLFIDSNNAGGGSGSTAPLLTPEASSASFVPIHPTTFFWCCLSTMLTPTTPSAGKGFAAIAGLDLIDLYEAIFDPAAVLCTEAALQARNNKKQDDDAADDSGVDEEGEEDPLLSCTFSSGSGAKTYTSQRLVGALSQACSLLLSELFGLSIGALRQLYFMQKPRTARNVVMQQHNSTCPQPTAPSSSTAAPAIVVTTQQVWLAQYGKMAPHFQILKLVEGIVSDLLLFSPALAIQTHAATTFASANASTGAGASASSSFSVYVPPTTSPLVLPLHLRSILFVELHTRIDEILIACGSGSFSANARGNFAATAAVPPPSAPPTSPQATNSASSSGGSSASSQQQVVLQVASNYSIPAAKLDAALSLSLQVPHSTVSGAPIHTMALNPSGALTTVHAKSLVSAHIVHGLQQWARVSEGTFLYAAVASAASCVVTAPAAAGSGGAGGSTSTATITNVTPKLPTGERFFAIEHPCPAPLIPTATAAGIKPLSYLSPSNSGVTIVGSGNTQLVEPSWGEFFASSYAAPVSGSSVSGIANFLSPFSVPSGSSIAATQHSNIVSQMSLFAKVWPVLFFSEMLQRGLFVAASGFAESLMGLCSPLGSSSSVSSPTAPFVPSQTNAMNLLSQYISYKYTGSSSIHLNLFLFPTRTLVGISHVLPAALPCASLNPPLPPSQQAQQQANTNNNSTSSAFGAGGANTTHTRPFVHSFVEVMDEIMSGPPPQVTAFVATSTSVSGGMASTTQTLVIPPPQPHLTSSSFVFNAQAQIASVLEKHVIGKILSVAAGPSAVASAAGTPSAAPNAPSTASTSAASPSSVTSAGATEANSSLTSLSSRDHYNEVYSHLAGLLPLLSLSQSYISAPTLVSNLFEALAVMVRVEGQLNYFEFLTASLSSVVTQSKGAVAVDGLAAHQFKQQHKSSAVLESLQYVRRQLRYLLASSSSSQFPRATESADQCPPSHVHPQKSESPTSWKWALLACELFVSVLTPCLRRQKSPSLPLLDAMEELLTALEEPHVVTMRPQKMLSAFSSHQKAFSTNALVAKPIEGPSSCGASSSSTSVTTLHEEITRSLGSFWSALASAVDKGGSGGSSGSAAAGASIAQLTPSAAIVRTATERILLQLLRERLPAAALLAKGSVVLFNIRTDNSLTKASFASSDQLLADLSDLLEIVPEFTPPTFVTSDLFCVPAVFIGDRLRQNKAFREAVADPQKPFFTKRSMRDREKLLSRDPALEYATLRYPHDHRRFVERSTLFNQCLRRVTSDNVHQYNLTLRAVILSEPVMVISKLISQALGNDDLEVTFCQAQLLQGVPRAILRMFVVVVIDRMFSIASEEGKDADRQVKLLGSLIAFVWAQNSNGFGSLSFAAVGENNSISNNDVLPEGGGGVGVLGGAAGVTPSATPYDVANGRSGCAAYIFRRMLRALNTSRTSTVLFVCELLQSLLLHMLHETLESEAKYTNQQLNALTCLPTSRWFASASSSSFLTSKWFDPQTMLLKKGGAGGDGRVGMGGASSGPLLSGPLGGALGTMGGGMLYGGANNNNNNVNVNLSNAALVTARMLAARDAERKAAADDAAAFGFMSSVFSTRSNLKPVPISAAATAAGSAVRAPLRSTTPTGSSAAAAAAVGAAKSSISAAKYSEAAFSYLNFIFSASFSPLTLYQCRIRFCDALAEPLDLNHKWCAAAHNVLAATCASIQEKQQKEEFSSAQQQQQQQPNPATVGEALIGHLTTLQTTVYSLYSDYPSASIERELTLAATYANHLNDLVLALVELQANYGGNGMMRHETGQAYRFFGSSSSTSAANANTTSSAVAGIGSGDTAALRTNNSSLLLPSPHILVGTRGLLRIPPAASSYPHVYNRCLLLLAEGRGENATATLHYKRLLAAPSPACLSYGVISGGGDNTRNPLATGGVGGAVPLAAVASRVSDVVWGLTVSDLAFSEEAYITAIRQLLLFVRQAMTGKKEGGGGQQQQTISTAPAAATSANRGTASTPAAPSMVVTATGGTIPASTAAAIAAMVGVSAVDKAAMEADAELLEYVKAQEREEEARLRLLFNDKAVARGKNQDDDNASSAAPSTATAMTAANTNSTVAVAATSTTAATTTSTGSSSVAQQQRVTASSSAFLFPSTVAVAEHIIAAKWLRLEQKVLIRLLLEQKDRIVAEARHHAKLINGTLGLAGGANAGGGAAAAATVTAGPAALSTTAVAELYQLLFLTEIDTEVASQRVEDVADDDSDDPNASAQNNRSVAGTGSACSGRQELHTVVAHDILCPRTLLSTRDALTVATLLECMYAYHMRKASEKADEAAKIMREQKKHTSAYGSASSSSTQQSVNVEEIIRQGATEKAEKEFLGLVYTYVTSLLTFLPSFTDSEARRATTALQRLFVLLHKSKVRRAVSQFIQLNSAAAAAAAAASSDASTNAADGGDTNAATSKTPATAPPAPAAAATVGGNVAAGGAVTALTLPSSPSVSIAAVLRNTNRVCQGIKRTREEVANAAAAKEQQQQKVSSCEALQAAHAAGALTEQQKKSSSNQSALNSNASSVTPIDTVLAPTPLDMYVLQLIIQALSECSPGRTQREDGSATILRNIFHVLGMMKAEMGMWITTASSDEAHHLPTTKSGGTAVEPQLRLAVTPPPTFPPPSSSAPSSSSTATTINVHVANFAAAAVEAIAPIPLFPSCPSHIKQLLLAVKAHAVSTSAQFAAASSMVVSYGKSHSVAADAPARWAVALENKEAALGAAVGGQGTGVGVGGRGHAALTAASRRDMFLSEPFEKKIRSESTVAEADVNANIAGPAGRHGGRSGRRNFRGGRVAPLVASSAPNSGPARTSGMTTVGSHQTNTSRVHGAASSTTNNNANNNNRNATQYGGRFNSSSAAGRSGGGGAPQRRL